MMAPDGIPPSSGSPLNLLGLVRLSTVEQAKEGKEGEGRQLDAIDRIQKQTGANIVETFNIIESGTHVLDNAKYQAFLKKLAQPGIDGVAVSQVDRLVRSDGYRDLTVFEPYRVHKKKIYIPGRMIEPYEMGGYIETIIYGMSGGIEKINIRDRTMGGK